MFDISTMFFADFTKTFAIFACNKDIWDILINQPWVRYFNNSIYE